eukprot:2839381-Prorocentrum_lima.AAC.1
MTSSLVGSEMCIRDSCCSVGAAVMENKAALRGHPCVMPCIFVNVCVSPVSYTHLTLPTICSV